MINLGGNITDAKSMLVEWTISNSKNRDILFKKIISIEKGKDGFDFAIIYKDKLQYFIVEPDLNGIDGITAKLNSEGHYAIVTFNKKANLVVIIRNWKKLAEFRNLCIYFVNPGSATDKKWVIFPYTHDKISDAASLELGLNSMFELVSPVI